MAVNLDEQLDTEETEQREISELEKDPALGVGMNFDSYSPFRIDLRRTDPLDWDKFLKKVDLLPISIKNLLTSADTVEFLIALSEKFDLSEEPSEALSRAVRDVLLADIFIGDLPMLISQKLEVDQNTANQIAQKVINELFAPAIEDVKKTQRERFADRVTQNRNSQSQQRPPQLPQKPNLEQGNVINLRNKENE